MKVAFWNGVSTNIDITNHVAAIGTILSLVYNCEVVLGGNYISNRMLQDCFSSRMKEEGVAHAPYRFLYGTSEYYEILWKMKKNRRNNILEIPMEGMTIIFPPDVTEEELFYYRVPPQVIYILDMAEENSAAFQKALDDADIVVIFLPQDAAKIQKFFYRFSSLIPKALFVFEGHHKFNGRFQQISAEKYGISNRIIGSIPNNTQYIEACEDGKLISYLKNQLGEVKKETRNYFITSLKKVADALYERSVHLSEEEVN